MPEVASLLLTQQRMIRKLLMLLFCAMIIETEKKLVYSPEDCANYVTHDFVVEDGKTTTV